MQAELHGAGLEFVRIPGLLATALPPSLRRHFFAADGRPAGVMKAGEIGCFAAHLSICERMVEGSLAPVALVMEDDCLLPGNLAEIVAAVLEVLPPSWDVVRLANQPKRAYVPLAVTRSGHEVIRYSRVPNCAAAYLISLAGARKLLGPDRKSCAFDEYLRRPWLHGCDSYGVWPAPIGFRDSPSSLDSPSNIDQIEDRDATRRNPLAKALSKTDLGNLPRRATYNIKALGLSRWLACAAINASDRLLKRFGSIDVLHRGSALLGSSGPEARRVARARSR